MRPGPRLDTSTILLFSLYLGPCGTQIATQHRLALADAVMYRLDYEFGAAIWTQDRDDQGLAGVQYCAKLRKSL